MADSKNFKQTDPINGTFGEMWLDGEYVCEAKGLKAVLKTNKEEVYKPRDLVIGHKVTKVEGTGSVTLYKTSSRMYKKIGEKLRNGEILVASIMTKLADPDSNGSERYVLEGVIFDDLTVADWERTKMGEIECPFTFDSIEAIDLI